MVDNVHVDLVFSYIILLSMTSTNKYRSSIMGVFSSTTLLRAY
jgi:hypothetical protein